MSTSLELKVGQIWKSTFSTLEIVDIEGGIIRSKCRYRDLEYVVNDTEDSFRFMLKVHDYVLQPPNTVELPPNPISCPHKSIKIHKYFTSTEYKHCADCGAAIP